MGFLFLFSCYCFVPEPNVFMSLHANMLCSVYCKSPDTHRKKWSEKSLPNLMKVIQIYICIDNVYIINVSLSKCRHSCIVICLFPHLIAIGVCPHWGVHISTMFTHTLIFTGWELKVGKTTKIKDSSLTSQAAQVTASSCLLMWDYWRRNLSPFFLQRNFEVSRTSHMEPVCANRNKRRLCLDPTLSIFTNSVQTYASVSQIEIKSQK